MVSGHFAGDLPRERRILLPGRGTTVVREYAGPPGAPVIVLLHGVALTGDLNWFGAIGTLGRHFRVVSFDQRGHGDGIGGGPDFRLEVCADDVAALARALGAERIVPVGYSMGGLVAQLVWRRHPDLVAGLVLCATACDFRGSPEERLAAMMLPTLAAVVSMTLPLHWLGAHIVGAGLLGRVTDPVAWRWAQAEMARTRLPSAVAAVHAVSRFGSSDWIGGVDVPTAVVVPTRDHLVSPLRQHRLAQAIPAAHTYEVDGDHGVFLTAPRRFAAVLLEACISVSWPAGPAVRPALPGPAATPPWLTAGAPPAQLAGTDARPRAT